DLRMKTKDHVFFQLNLRIRADGRILNHGHADGVASEVAEREDSFTEDVGRGFVDFAVYHAIAHLEARRFHSLWIHVAHRLRARTDFAANKSARKFDPVPRGAGDFQRIEQQVVGADLAK